MEKPAIDDIINGKNFHLYSPPKPQSLVDTMIHWLTLFADFPIAYLVNASLLMILLPVVPGESKCWRLSHCP